MERIKLMDGSEYQLAINGLHQTNMEVNLKLVTERSLDEICAAFTRANTQIMEIFGDSFQMKLEGYSRRGNSMTRRENSVIATKLIQTPEQEAVEENDSAGEMNANPKPVLPGVEKVYGTVVEFSMFKDSVEERVEQNRADIDYLLMMEEVPDEQ